ncbi:MAG: hypothetical protein HQ553_17260 [Chloroflexi bacterium]|nr:hypothetical protein [Chloroflexota bacterium]
MVETSELDVYLKVLVLRVLDVSLTDAAKAVCRATQVALDAERWIKTSPQREVEMVVGDDDRIRRLVGRDLPGSGLVDAVLVKAGQVTGDDILKHYKRDRSIDPTTGPLDVKSLRRHFGRLRLKAETMRNQLQVPEPSQILSPETCGMVISSQLSGAIQWPGPQWGSCFGTSVEWRQTTDIDDILVEVRLPLEADDTFGNLHDHLSAESPEMIDAFVEWRETMGQWLQLCLEQVHQTVGNCRERTGLDYVGSGIPEGLFSATPAYVGQFAWHHPDANATPQLDRIAREEKWCLVPSGLPGWGLVLGPPDALDQISQALTKLIADTAGQPVWTRIRQMHDDLGQRTAQMRSQLTTIIERGEFKGTCPACPGGSSPVASD